MEQILNDKGKQTISDLITNYDKLGLRASGSYAKTLSYDVIKTATGYNFIIWGKAYGEFMENGRGATRGSRPTSKGQPGELIKAIKQWVKDKGVNISPYAITAKIHRDGIKVPNRFNKGGVISGVINKKYIDDLLNDISTGRLDYYFSEILNKF